MSTHIGEPLPFTGVFLSKVLVSPGSPQDLVSLIQQLASQFAAAAKQLLQVIDLTVIDLSRAAYITVILLGVFLYFTRLERRLGKDMIKGGIVLALLTEFLFPLISKG